MSAFSEYIIYVNTLRGAIHVNVVHKQNSCNQTVNLFFDQYTFKLLEKQVPYTKKYPIGTSLLITKEII